MRASSRSGRGQNAGSAVVDQRSNSRCWRTLATDQSADTCIAVSRPSQAMARGRKYQCSCPSMLRTDSTDSSQSPRPATRQGEVQHHSHAVDRARLLREPASSRKELGKTSRVYCSRVGAFRPWRLRVRGLDGDRFELVWQYQHRQLARRQVLTCQSGGWASSLSSSQKSCAVGASENRAIRRSAEMSCGPSVRPARALQTPTRSSSAACAVCAKLATQRTVCAS